MDLKEMGLGDMDWIDMFRDIDQWRALLNIILKLRFP
jgi:hypothetical protein